MPQTRAELAAPPTHLHTPSEEPSLPWAPRLSAELGIKVPGQCYLEENSRTGRMTAVGQLPSLTLDCAGRQTNRDTELLEGREVQPAHGASALHVVP